MRQQLPQRGIRRLPLFESAILVAGISGVFYLTGQIYYGSYAAQLGVPITLSSAEYMTAGFMHLCMIIAFMGPLCIIGRQTKPTSFSNALKGNLFFIAISLLCLLWSFMPLNILVRIYAVALSVNFLGFLFWLSWSHRSFAYDLWTRPDKIKLFLLSLIVLVVFVTAMAAGDFIGSLHFSGRLGTTEVRFYFKNKESQFHAKAFRLLRYDQGRYYILDRGECSAKHKCVRIVPESEIEMAVLK